MNDKLKNAIKVLTTALKEDEDYRRTWSDNIAMAFQDEFSESSPEYGIHFISNAAAERFLDILCRDQK